MPLRRRPLLGAAIIGGTAYHAGKRRVQNQDREDAQNQQLYDLQQQNAQMQQQLQQQATQPPAPAAAAAPAAAGGITEQLTQLKSLLDSGVLTQEEFEAAKAKAIAGG